MKRILYILCSPHGKLAQLTCAIKPEEQAWSDDALLNGYDPASYPPARFNDYIRRGYSLSNWHVITIK